MPDEDACDMRGMLSFMILWLLSKRPMYGQEMAAEIEKRRGEKPNPGTIYPALKDLAGRGMVESHLEGRNNVYELTERGQTGLLKALEYFRNAFGEIFDSSAPVPKRALSAKQREISSASPLGEPEAKAS